MHKCLGLTLILSTIFLAGCGKEISKEFLVISNGKFYEQGSHEPYSGTVLNDSPNGPGLRFLPIDPTAKVSCISRMSDGVYDGQFTCQDNNTGNPVLELSFKSGKQEGKRTVYNSKTKDLVQVTSWENGILNGEEQIYIDGKIACETEYKNGKKHGKQICWGVAETRDPTTWGSAYHRVSFYQDSEKTIDAIYEDGNIRSGLLTFSTPIIAMLHEGKVPVLISKQHFSDGKKDGMFEDFILPSYEGMEKKPLAFGEFKSGNQNGKFTYYALDGKSICAEKVYENGVKVSGLINQYSKDGYFSGQVKLAKHNSIDAFVMSGIEKIIQKYKEDKDTADCAYNCKTREHTWENGVILKSVITDYGVDFKNIENIATQELIKESIQGTPPKFHSMSPSLEGFCALSSPLYVGDIAIIDHKLYTSEIIDYEDNKAKDIMTCPYGATDAIYAGTAGSLGVGCTTKSLLSAEEQKKIQEQQQEREQEHARELAREQTQEQAIQKAQERERYLAASRSSTDDCSTYLETAGITAKISDSLDMGEKTQISIMFSNISKDNYEVPVVRVGSCEFVNRAAILPEMSEIKAGETITQSYLCGADFMNNDLPVKMYLKYPGAVTATSACTTIPSQSPSETESLKVKEGDGHRSASFPSPSFDCAKAGTSIEKLICSDSYIGNLDGMLGQNYKALFGDKYGFDEAGKKSTKDEQKAWVAKRNACTTKECVIAAYKSRIDEICEIPVAIGVNDCQSWVSLGEANP